jgi:sialic acid synthase SpsE
MLTREKEIEFNNVLSKIRNFDQINVIGTGGEYHYADLQILYVKGRDLAKRIISEYNSTNTFVSKKVVDNKEIPIVPAKYFPAKPFVIAEIGLNHGGNIEIAKKLLIEAKRVGVKFAKFQAYKTESRISAAYRANNYFEEVVGTEENLFQMFKKCELSFEDFRILFDFASEIRINMFSAVFDIESLKMLEDLKCPAYKIASMDVNNTPLLKEVAKTKKPIILSTGMSSLGEIEKAVNILSGSDSQELIILHCVSSYPASFDSLNLKSIHTLQSAFDHSVGFSDHSVGIIAPIVAVSIGATAIEKHFTLNKSMEGPDHIFSLEPKEMGELVEIIDNIPKILGSSFKKVFRQELDTAFKFKKSIHAKSFIRKGEYFSEVNLEIKGPGEGLSPELWDELIGRSSKSDILPDHPITWRDI